MPAKIPTKTANPNTQALSTSAASARSKLYLIHGDDPLQHQSLRLSVRAAAKSEGYSERRRIDIKQAGDWAQLPDNPSATQPSLALFAKPQLIEVSWEATHAPNREAGHCLHQWLLGRPADACYLLLAPPLTAAQRKSPWFRYIQTEGQLYEANAPKSHQWPHWVKTQFESAGFVLEAKAFHYLTESYTGNPLAIAQLLKQLACVLPSGRLDWPTLQPFMDATPQFSVFALAQASLQGELSRCFHILACLEQDAVAPTLIRWALTRALLQLLSLHERQNLGAGCTQEEAMNQQGIWASEKASVRAAMKRLCPTEIKTLLQLTAALDAMEKGLHPGDPWQGLSLLCSAMAGQAWIPVGQFLA